MSFSMSIIENLYSLLDFLAKHTGLLGWIMSNEYEYDDKILPPLAMTKVPTIKILGYLIPKLPNADELPSPEWFASVLIALTILKETEKSTNASDRSISSDNKLNSLKSIEKEIKDASGQEDLTKAVLKFKSVQQKKVSPTTKNTLSLNSNPSKIENVFDEIDREIQAHLSRSLQEEPATALTALKIDRVDEVDEVEGIDRGDRELYKHLQEIARSLGEELIDNQADSTERLEGVTLNRTVQDDEKLKDYEKLINPLKIRPETLDNFKEDRVFAYMQVAGPNPVMLNQIKELDSRLLITSEQYQEIVHQEIVQGDALEAALQEGRLYLADYSKLDALENSKVGGSQKYIYAPVALFAVPPEQYPDKNLLPIAIRCQQIKGDENPIFTPLDGDNWMTAKTVLQMADSNYHELISHLAQTHLFIEPFVLATNICFTDDNHAVKVLLKPHLQGTILINYGAHASLLAQKGPIDFLLSGTIDSNSQLAIKEAMSHLANFNEVAFPRTLEKRGVNNPQQLPIYPYRDDGQQIWDAIYQWVHDYLHVYYPSDDSVKGDTQLQNWARELFHKGHCHIGEEADGNIKTLDYLVEAISTVIFTASAQHAAVNFPQSGLMTYAPAFPLGCYSPAPTNPEQQQDFMGSLPPLDQAKLQIQVLYLLGSVYYTSLLDYPGSSFKKNVKTAFDNFKAKLNDIEAKIVEADKQRLVPYRFLQPSQIPLSINI